MQVWNDAYAFAYPALDTNSNGEVGIIVGRSEQSHQHRRRRHRGLRPVHADSKATPQTFGDYITIAGPAGPGRTSPRSVTTPRVSSRAALRSLPTTRCSATD